MPNKDFILTPSNGRRIIQDMPKRSSKKKDINELAKFIVNEATDEEVMEKAIDDGKNPYAVLLGRKGGLKGGKSRAEKLSAEKRSEIARKAAQARWLGKKKEL